MKTKVRYEVQPLLGIYAHKKPSLIMVIIQASLKQLLLKREAIQGTPQHIPPEALLSTLAGQGLLPARAPCLPKFPNFPLNIPTYLKAMYRSIWQLPSSSSCLSSKINSSRREKAASICSLAELAVDRNITTFLHVLQCFFPLPFTPHKADRMGHQRDQAKNHGKV